MPAAHTRHTTLSAPHTRRYRHLTHGIQTLPAPHARNTTLAAPHARHTILPAAQAQHTTLPRTSRTAHDTVCTSHTAHDTAGTSRTAHNTARTTLGTTGTGASGHSPTRWHSPGALTGLRYFRNIPAGIEQEHVSLV